MSFDSGPIPNHYDVLGVPLSATLHQISSAYRFKMFTIHSKVTKKYSTFGRARAKTVEDEVLLAWSILSDPAAKAAYDRDFFSQHINTTPSSPDARTKRSADTSSQTRWPGTFEAADPSTKDSHSDTDACENGEPPAGENAVGAYRYMKTSTGTVIDVAIGGWRFQLNLSLKFHFVDDVTEISVSCENSDTISFQFSLYRNLSSAEQHYPSINEISVRMVSPAEGYHISHLGTVFKELKNQKYSSLILTLTKQVGSASQSKCPWEFGFDFDMNQKATCGNRGTCLLFSGEEPVSLMQTYVGPDSPDYELKKDKALKADGFAEMYSQRLVKIKYSDVEMWRLAAVGYQHESFL